MLKVICLMNRIGTLEENTLSFFKELQAASSSCQVIIGTGVKMSEDDLSQLRDSFKVLEQCTSLAHLLNQEDLFDGEDYILPVFVGEQFCVEDILFAAEQQDHPGYAIIHGSPLQVSSLNLKKLPHKFPTLNGICTIRYRALQEQGIVNLDISCPDEVRLLLSAAIVSEDAQLPLITTPSVITTAKIHPEKLSWYGEGFFKRYETLGKQAEAAHGSVPYHIQYALGYQLVARFKANMGKANACARMREESARKKFFQNCCRILKYVDNRVLMNLDAVDYMRCPEPLITLMSNLKLGLIDGEIKFEAVQELSDLHCCVSDSIITCASKKRITLEKIQATDDGNICIKLTTNGVFESAGCHLQATVNGVDLTPAATKGSPFSVFGKNIFRRAAYNITLDKAMIDNQCSIAFFYALGQEKCPLFLDKITQKFELELSCNANTLTVGNDSSAKTTAPQNSVSKALTSLQAFVSSAFKKPSLLVGLLADDSQQTLDARLNALTATQLYQSKKMTIVIFTKDTSNLSIGKMHNVYIVNRDALSNLKKFKNILLKYHCSYFTWASNTGHMTDSFYDDAVAYMAANKTEILVPATAHDGTFTPSENNCIDLNATPQHIPTECRGSIFSTKLLLDDTLDQNAWDVISNIDFEDEQHLAALCLLTRKHPHFVQFSQHAFILETAIAEDGTAYRWSMDENWYFPSVDKFFLAVASMHEGNLPIRSQYILLYRLLFRLSFNENQHDTHVISSDRLADWKQALSKVLQHISDEVIVDLYRISKFHTKPHIALWLLQIKHGKNYTSSIRYCKNSLILNVCGLKLLTSETQAVQIEVLDHDKDALVLECSTPGFFEVNNIMPQAEFNGHPLTCENSYYFSHRKLFAEDMWKRYTFRVRVPYSILEEGKLTFFYTVGGYRFPLKLLARRFPAKLNDTVPGSYCHCRDYLINFGKKRAFLNIFPYSEEKHQALEAKLQELCINSATDETRENMQYLMNLRNRYYATREEFVNRNIWITFDKLYKAGDNGEYFMRHAKDQNDDVEIHYIMNEGYPDVERLLADGIRPLYFMTEEHILHFLNSRVIAATHANIPTFSGVPTKEFKYLQDLLKAEIVCIQHGLAVQWMPHNLYAGYDNTKRFYCASESELNNLGHQQYGYGPGALRLTGLSRYDGLVDQSKRQILLSPTWRSYIAMPSVAGNARPYSDTFKDTTYYKVFNGLIQNEKLTKTAQKCGYRIVYLLHPTLSSQTEDFTPAPGVEVRSPIGESYEAMMTQSDLMITDFSGIQFDFAYMRKPIVYYHPDELPAGYGEGGFNYAEQGFGPVCTNEEALVDAVCNYMEQECRLDEFYAGRQNRFFAYDDHDNCSRIYRDLLAFDKKQHSDEREVQGSGFNSVPVIKTRVLNNAGRTRIYWEPCPYNTGYEILASAEQFGSYQLIETVDDLRRNYLVPEQYQNFWFKVRALFCDGEIKGNCSAALRSGSATDNATDLEMEPAEILCCVKDHNSGIRIFWRGSDKVVSWNIYCRIGEETNLIAKTANVCTWEYRHAEGDPSKDPYYSVEPIYRNFDGELVTGPVSAEMTMTPRCHEKISVDFFAVDGAHISWEEQDGPGEYELYRRHSDRGRYDLVARFEEAPQITYIDPHVEQGLGRYLLKKKTQDEWQVSVATKFYDPVMPVFPSEVFIGKHIDGRTKLEWLKTQNATQWVIYRRLEGQIEETEVAQLPGNAISWIASENSVTAEEYRAEVSLDEHGSMVKLSTKWLSLPL